MKTQYKMMQNGYGRYFVKRIQGRDTSFLTPPFNDLDGYFWSKTHLSSRNGFYTEKSAADALKDALRREKQDKLVVVKTIVIKK